MSAIRMVCERCETEYMAGVVGSTPWPAHECPPRTMGSWPDGQLRMALGRWCGPALASARYEARCRSWDESQILGLQSGRS